MSEKRNPRHQRGPRHMGPPGMGGPAEKAKNFKGTLKRLIAYLKPQRISLFVVVIFAVVATVFTVVGPKISGNAMNDLVNGYISGQIVKRIGKAQPDLQDMLKKYYEGIEKGKKKANKAVEKAVKKNIKKKKLEAYALARSKAGEAVENAVNQNISQKKQQAYAMATTKANEAVEKAVNDGIKTKKQAAYKTAKQKAGVAVEKAVNDSVAKQKQAAYSQAISVANQKIDAQMKGLPKSQIDAAKKAAQSTAKSQVDKAFAQNKSKIKAQIKSAKKIAEAKAVAAVDKGFAQNKSKIDKQMQSAKKMAKAKAIAAVDKGFIDNQGTINTQIASAKNMAHTKAKQAVDKAFKKNQSKIDKQIIKAKSKAEKKVIEAVDKAFLKKGKMTKAQFLTFKKLAALPLITSTNDYNKRADIVQTFFDSSKKLPKKITEDDSTLKSSNIKMTNISDDDLNKYVGYVRTYGGYIPFDVIWQTILVLLGIYLLSSLFTFIMQFIMSTVAQKVVYNLRKNVDDKLSRLPLKYFDSHSNGEILSRMSNDIDTISTTLQQSLTQAITSICQLIGYLIMMLTISPLLTLFVMLTLPLYAIVTMLIAKKSQKHFAAQQKHLGALSGHTEEMFTGHKIVKAFGREKQVIDTFEQQNSDLYKSGWKAQFFSGTMFPLMNFISNLGYVLISVVGGIFVTKTWLGIGDITAFIQYSRQFTMPIIQTANIANVIQSTIACAERVFEVLDEEEEIPDPQDAKIIALPNGNIKFDHVAFSYNEEQPLIEDMNLDIRKGETIAIVGPTGAGKTTLVNLLMRFYEIKDGSITFDGIDLRDIARGNLRRNFGMVLQDTWLFNGTIEDNIRYGRSDATHEEVVKAADTAYADHFIRSLPDGYNTILNEDASNISQGQKQLLTIARAILANPTVLILDEATSSVDTRTEMLIQKAMTKLMSGRTSFVIAHRLSTIRDAKTILFMKHGTIVESGNHYELLDKNGAYADLYNSQFVGASVSE